MVNKKFPSTSPVIAEEQQVLDELIRQIQDNRASFEESLEWNVNPKTAEGLRAAADTVDLARPYFGHFIATTNADPGSKLDLRIGKEGAQTNPQIISWDAEIAHAYHMRQGEPGITGRFQIFSRREIDIIRAEVIGISNSYGFRGLGSVDRDDDVVLESTSDSNETAVAPSRLTRALDRDREHGFDDIVETIQPDQFIEVSRSASGPLLLDGVAGSGKTTVALHRIAYITSAQRTLDVRVDINKVVALGPSKQFNTWSSSIKIPGLGPLRHNTVPGFMWSWLQGVFPTDRIRFEQKLEHEPIRTPTKATVERVESAIRITCAMPESLRSPATTSAFRVDVPYRRAEVDKRMNLSDWRKFWRSGPGLITVTDEENRPGASSAYIDLFRAKAFFEPTLTISELEQDVVGLLTKDAERTIEMLGRVIPSDITSSILLLLVSDDDTAVAEWIRQHLDQSIAFIKSASWSQRNKEYVSISGIVIQNISEVARRLEISPEDITHIARQTSADANHPISSRFAFLGELQRVGSGLGMQRDRSDKSIAGRELRDGWEAQVRNQIQDYVDAHWPLVSPERLLPWPISREAEESDQPDRDSLAVLCAAVVKNIAADDPLRSPLSHIVVDEAQELTEAEIVFLSKVARDQSLTFVGDLRQSLDGQSESDWNRYRGVLSDELSVATFDKSYRSTASITAFCNEILRRRGISQLAEPYAERPGVPVEIKCGDDLAEHDRSVSSWLENVLANGGTACIIVPESDSQTMLHHYRGLVNQARRHNNPSIATDALGSEILVMFPNEVRGLEFNHVAVVLADLTNYPITPIAGAALYVACTRATTTLQVLSYGNISPFIVNNGNDKDLLGRAKKGEPQIKAERQLAQHKAEQKRLQIASRKIEAESVANLVALLEEVPSQVEKSEPSKKPVGKQKKSNLPKSKRDVPKAAKGWSIFGSTGEQNEEAPKKKSGWSIFGSNDE
jgi:hypothetical protein